MESVTEPDYVQEAFSRAIRDFESQFSGPKKIPNLRDITTCDQLYDAMDKLQAEQAKHGPYKNLWLARIHPLIERLRIFSNVVDVLVQVKPEILGFIWAPIKLILMSTARWREGFEKAVEEIAKIGQDIPDLMILKSQISQSRHSKRILSLYFADLLDFYAELIHLFYKPKLQRLLTPLWPGVLERLDRIRARMRGHIELITRRATFQHIRDSEDARVKMLKEFRDAEISRVKQAFAAMEASINPRMYDDRLAWLRSRFCPGTSKWLEKDEAFLEWIDRSSSMSPRILWLHGIPGAGKTFLASQVTTMAKETGPTLFAFSSHVQTDTTDISLLHSLLFQLAYYDPELPPALIASSKQDLKTKSEISIELLSEGLKRVGRAYIIVDGLDEVEEFSRKKFLLHLLQVVDVCKDLPLRLFFGSRAEDDIKAILNPRASVISVHANNAVGIQAYVNHRFEEWMAESDFSPEGACRIKALLARLANNAKGMFLYARIVIDNVRYLTSIDDISRDLEALPEDLDEAYKRAFARIEALPSSKRKTVLRILGWIGCSPVPLKQHEMEQALLVAASTHADAPAVDTSLRIINLCGPIVEIVEDTPLFVHFTVKQYIFKHERKIINMSDSVLDLLVTCTIYLCYESLDPELEDEQVEENILAGRYRFQQFASLWWFALAKKYVRSTRDAQDLSGVNTLLQNLYDECENRDFRVNVDEIADGGQEVTLPTRPPPWPDAPDFMAHTIRFLEDHPKDLWTSNNEFPPASTWAFLDPLTVSESCARVEVIYSQLLCSDRTRDGRRSHKGDCVCQVLHRHYGKRLYKCHDFACSFRRDGFEEESERAEHMMCHSKPWKCSVKACVYSYIGFSSSNGLETHRQRFHQVIRATAYTQPASIDDEALYPLLFGLVECGNISELRKVWPSCHTKVDRSTTAELLAMAASHGQLEMVTMLLPWDDKVQKPHNERVDLGKLTHDCLQSGNIELATWILKKATLWGAGTSSKYRVIVVAVLKSESPEIFQIWHDLVAALNPQNFGAGLEMFEIAVLRTAARLPEQEARLFDTWRVMRENRLVLPLEMSKALAYVAQSTYSETQARVLIELGANVNYPWAQRARGKTILQWACKKSSEEAAKFIRFLLLQGADVDMYMGAKPLYSEDGARKIKVWLGMNFDELVRWASEQRKSKSTKQAKEIPFDEIREAFSFT